ncbi:MAG: hypothetical protein MHM6MM_003282, partial [Cercozoa sp. M6MM]
MEDQKRRLQLYFFQLTLGCGRKPRCSSEYCATNDAYAAWKSVPKQQAVKQALRLMRANRPLCPGMENFVPPEKEKIKKSEDRPRSPV